MKKIRIMMIGVALIFASALQAQVNENVEGVAAPKPPNPPKKARAVSGVVVSNNHNFTYSSAGFGRSNGPKSWKEIKVPNLGNKLLLKLDNVYIEGYKGKDVLITAKVEESEENDRAKGLRVINGSGLSDNSGLGMNIKTEGGVTEISMVGMPLEDSIRIRIPMDLPVTIKGGRGAMFNAGEIELKDILAEVEVASTMGNVNLLNVTGPINVKVAQGDVTAKFVQPVKGPISLVAAMGAVDVAFPKNFGANVDVKSAMGNIYAADEFQFEKQSEEPKSTPMGNAVKGKMNGGGQDVILKTSMGDIYIRTQK
ncbi:MULTISPECIES: DUF4097 family beta strand repeat-containing protein [Sphingobacterium]|uniref:DUF4097 family beta strand repeat-containing protein n=1 Tax=Sphingobacterium TaxID=28453 RepID=UPI00257EB3B3|nr:MULTISPECIES: DUF4097 family beta strand repeat-containing protein [Sphingobacterium]